MKSHSWPSAASASGFLQTPLSKAPRHYAQALRFAFSRRGTSDNATCLNENPASSRVLEKIGMRKEGYQAKNLKVHGVWHDSYLYAILGRNGRRGVALGSHSRANPNY